jgi:6-phosphofructokinase 1
MELDYQKLGPLLTRGGTILAPPIADDSRRRSARRDATPAPGVDRRREGGNGEAAYPRPGQHRRRRLLSIAQQLFEGGVPIVGVPKTIDNDLEGTVMTFGFDSAVACATDALDRLHTTAESHKRVMVLEVMGRYAGWIALYAGVAAGPTSSLCLRSRSPSRASAPRSRNAKSGQTLHPDHRGRRCPGEGR